MTNDASFNVIYFFQTSWSSVYLVLTLLRENVFALNYSKTLFNFELAEEKICIICKQTV